VLADGTLGSIQNDAYGNSFVYAFTLGATSASINPLFAEASVRDFTASSHTRTERCTPSDPTVCRGNALFD